MRKSIPQRRLERARRRASIFQERPDPQRLEGETKRDHDKRVKQHRAVMKAQTEAAQFQVARLEAVVRRQEYDSPGKE